MEEHFEDYEILFSSDGSTDGCDETVRSLGLPNVKVVGYEKNRGKGCAVRTAVLQAEGDVVMFTDADLAYGTDVILGIAKAFEEHPDALANGERIGSSLILQAISENDFIYKLFGEIAEAAEPCAYRSVLVHAALLALSGKGLPVMPSKAGGCELSKRALQIINRRLGEKISLPSVAQELFVSPQYLSAVFKKNIGITFVEHLGNVRLRRAAMLLLETKDSITHIGEVCGYGNLSHFLRCFKRFYGVSPSVYRKNNAKQQ
jgi:AraC-like DNA-binding protein